MRDSSSAIVNRGEYQDITRSGILEKKLSGLDISRARRSVVVVVVVVFARSLTTSVSGSSDLPRQKIHLGHVIDINRDLFSVVYNNVGFDTDGGVFKDIIGIIQNLIAFRTSH